MTVEIISGDLLESDAKYICHQCNCITTHSAGIAFYIFDKFPYANIYKNRKEWDVPGTIEICGDGKDQRYIINMLAQVYPGKPGYPDSLKDGYIAREKYFQQCLDKIAEIEELDSLAFPYKIGCNLAKGNWDNYYQMICDFADRVEAKVYIYKLNGA
jgi:O-acetyl-ADP-ribose deacetylase (regulator of RNase III)